MCFIKMKAKFATQLDLDVHSVINFALCTDTKRTVKLSFIVADPSWKWYATGNLLWSGTVLVTGRKLHARQEVKL